MRRVLIIIACSLLLIFMFSTLMSLEKKSVSIIDTSSFENNSIKGKVEISANEEIETNVFKLKVSGSSDYFYSHIKTSSSAAIAEFKKLIILSDNLWEYQ